MWKAGDTFQGNVIEKSNRHLHIVLSDPYMSKKGEVVVLTFMSSYNGESKTEEDSCILEEGEHPDVDHRSYLVYNDCVEIPVVKLDEKLQSGAIKIRTPLSKELLVRAIDGLVASRFVSGYFKNIGRRLQVKLMD